VSFDVRTKVHCGLALDSGGRRWAGFSGSFWPGLTAMLESLFSVIVETLFGAAAEAIVKLFGWENAAELVTAVVGLACIGIGFTAWWMGH
jgi:hypothetical protein